MATEPLKACSRCRIDKPASDYSPDRRASDGLQPTCRKCCAARKKETRDANIVQMRSRERAYVQANKDRVYAANNEWRAKNADKVKELKKGWYEQAKHRPEFQARIKARQEANKEAKRLYDQEYRAKTPEKQREWARAWVKANPKRRAAIVHNYTARRRKQTEGGVSTAELVAWTNAQKKVCYWCAVKCPKGFHVDHYIPLSKGGPHEISNLVISCGPCNLKKNAKDPLDFAREVGRLL